MDYIASLIAVTMDFSLVSSENNWKGINNLSLLIRKRKSRASPFSPVEDRVLIEQYAKHRDVLESSAKEGVNLAMKAQAWEQIVGQVNTVFFFLIILAFLN